MCLTTKRILPNVALKDIEVYKVYLMKDDDSELVSPYQFTHYHNDVEEITPFSKRVLSKRRMGCFFEREVREGYIHAWQHKSSARLAACYACLSACYTSLDFAYSTPVIWKCVIPKGTLYFKGNTDICAKKLKIVEKLDSVAEMRKKVDELI